MPPAPKQAAYGLEIWVQPGIPEDNELVFNVHFRNAEGTEWEVKLKYYLRIVASWPHQ